MYIYIIIRFYVYDLINIFTDTHITYILSGLRIYLFITMCGYQSSQKDTKIKSGDLFDLSTARASRINSIKSGWK